MTDAKIYCHHRLFPAVLLMAFGLDTQITELRCVVVHVCPFLCSSLFHQK